MKIFSNSLFFQKKILLFLSIFIHISLIYNLFSENESSYQEKNRATLILEGRYEYALSQRDEGNKAMLNQHYLDAVKYYKNALDALPQIPSSASLSQEVLFRLNKGILFLASQESSEADIIKYNYFIKTILTDFYTKTYPDLLTLKNQLNHISISPFTRSSLKAQQKSRELLDQANCYYEQESWNDALQVYKKILRDNPNNSVALLGIELIDQKIKKENYYLKNEKKEQMIEDIEKAWDLPLPSEVSRNFNKVEKADLLEQKKEALSYQLRSLIIPNISFNDITLEDAIHELKEKIQLLKSSEENSNIRDINIILKTDILHGYPYKDIKIHLFLSNIPLGEILKYIAQEAHLKINIEPYAVTLLPINETTDPLIIKEFHVPLYFFNTSSFCFSASLNTNETSSLFSAKEALLAEGISFPQGATAQYLLDDNLLTVRNTEFNLNLIASLIETAKKHPPYQVEIEARFLEVKQSRWNEKGLDWLLGSFTLPFGTGVQGGGGTVGHQAAYNNNNYPIQQNEVPVGSIPGGPLGAGSVTSGNRLGTTAITANALDALLGSGLAPATGVLALAGVFTTPQFQVVLRALHQQKGISLLSSPKVTVSSGRKATITIAREFPYPADYLPPLVPQNQGSGVNPAIPATPATFKKRDVGVQLEVEPTVGLDHSTIELKLSPQIVEFQGFINYGNPIFSQAPTLLGIGQNNATGSTTQVLLTENNINQPVFSVRQVDTQVSLKSGQTLVLGGLMREDVQKVKDKTPFIGDLPLLGNLFRSTSEQRIKRNLLIFVTVRILDSHGRKMK